MNTNSNYSLLGPALKIDTFVFQQMPGIDENEELDFIYEIRVQFDSQVNESVIRMVDIKNVGTTVFYYEWQQKPYTKPFDIVNSKVQRFYFDNRTSNSFLRNSLSWSFVVYERILFLPEPVFQCYEIPLRSHGRQNRAHASSDRLFFFACFF